MVGGWLWIELWTHDADAATRFYADLVGYELEVLELYGHPYPVFVKGDVPRAGVVNALRASGDADAVAIAALVERVGAS